MLTGGLLWILVPAQVVCTSMAKELGWDEGVTWLQDILVRLPEEVETSTVFQLQELDANLVRRHPGPPNLLMCGPYQSDGDPTLDLSPRPRLGFLSLFC